MTFLAIRAALLWLVVSINVVGAAALFKRLFPRESPWFRGTFTAPSHSLEISSETNRKADK